MNDEVQDACARATTLEHAVETARREAWGALASIAVAVRARDLGDLFGDARTVRALEAARGADALSPLVKTVGRWRRSLERSAARGDGDGSGPPRRRRRRLGAVAGLVALAEDGLGATAFAATVLGGGFASPADVGRLAAACAAFGARRPAGIAGQRPWLSLCEASLRRVAGSFLRPSLRASAASLPLATACAAYFQPRRLVEAVQARSGPLVAWRGALRVGDRLDVMDNDTKRARGGDRGRWCEAELVGRTDPPSDRSRTRALWTVHFRGWDAKFDERVFAEHAERFRPAWSRVPGWRSRLAAGDEVEVRRPADAHAPRTFWFQGVVLERRGDAVDLRLQVVDASLQSSVDTPWRVPVDSERIAMKFEHISPELWQDLR